MIGKVTFIDGWKWVELTEEEFIDTIEKVNVINKRLFTSCIDEAFSLAEQKKLPLNIEVIIKIATSLFEKVAVSSHTLLLIVLENKIYNLKNPKKEEKKLEEKIEVKPEEKIEEKGENIFNTAFKRVEETKRFKY